MLTALVAVGTSEVSELLLLLPGIVALPVYSLLPNLGGKGIPFSLPGDDAKSAGRAQTMIGVTMLSMALAGVASLSWWTGYFWLLIVVELIVVAVLYVGMSAWASAARWPSLE